MTDGVPGEPPPRFGRWLAQELHLRGLNPPEFAARIGRSRSVVCGWLRADYLPTLESLSRIAAGLGLDQADVLAAAGIIPPDADARPPTPRPRWQRAGLTPFGRWLAAEIECRGLPQAAFTRRVGVSPAALQAWLRGGPPPGADEVGRVAAALRIDHDELRRRAADGGGSSTRNAGGARRRSPHAPGTSSTKRRGVDAPATARRAAEDGRPEERTVEGVAAGHDGTQADVYTMAEAARLKGVSYHTVSRAVRRGVLAHRRIGRMVFVTAADLAAWRPMVARAPKSYRRREPDPAAAPAMLDLAAGDRVALAQRYAALAEVVHAGAVGKGVASILALVCDRLSDALALRRGAAWGVDEPAGVARCLASSRGQSGAWPDEVALGAIAALVDFAAGAGEAVVVPADAFGPATAALATGPALVAPMRSGGRAIGFLVGDRGGAPFALEPDQLAFALALAGLAGAAVETARLRSAVAADQGDPAFAVPAPEPPHLRRLASRLRRLAPSQVAVLESVADALIDGGATAR